MPIKDYGGKTFVAFMDLCGFKELMRIEGKAWRALDSFYKTGYQVLKDEYHQSLIEGLFISDSGILFIRKNQQQDLFKNLFALLSAIKKINRIMLNNDLMLTTSIAYGEFKYQERIEFVGIEKNAIYGNAYASAYFDNANGNPRIQPGQCRLIKQGLPVECTEDDLCALCSDLIRIRAGDSQHYYYYWNVDYSSEIDSFEERYKDTYNLRFQGILKALKRY